MVLLDSSTLKQVIPITNKYETGKINRFKISIKEFYCLHLSAENVNRNIQHTHTQSAFLKRQLICTDAFLALLSLILTHMHTHTHTHTQLDLCSQSRMRYLRARGTLLMTRRPSQLSEAKSQGSADDHSAAYTLSSCSSQVDTTLSFRGSLLLNHTQTAKSALEPIQFCV